MKKAVLCIVFLLFFSGKPLSSLTAKEFTPEQNEKKFQRLTLQFEELSTNMENLDNLVKQLEEEK